MPEPTAQEAREIVLARFPRAQCVLSSILPGYRIKTNGKGCGYLVWRQTEDEAWIGAAQYLPLLRRRHLSRHQKDR